jgi:hypothetical protein
MCPFAIAADDSSEAITLAKHSTRRYLRQIIPAKNPSPTARTSVDSGRSCTAPSSESPSEDPCDCALLATTPSRPEASLTIDPILVRACFIPLCGCSCATVPRSLDASEIWSESPPIAFLMFAISFSKRAKALSPVSRVSLLLEGRRERQTSSVYPKHAFDVNVGPRGRFPAGDLSVFVNIQTLLQDQRHHQNWR